MGIDPFHLLASVLPAIYAIPSRRINAQRPAVVSLGQIHGGATSNVIPESIYLEGTMRSYDPDVRLQLRTELEKAFSIVEALGGSYALRIRPWFGALYNDPTVNGWVREVSAELLGAENVVEMEFGMGSEDFAFMAAVAPGVQFLVGAALPDGIDRPHHTDIFAIDERVLPVGAAILAETARRYVTGELHD
jgi:amidohydrolase